MGIGGAAIFLDRDGVLNPLVLNPATGRMESPLTPEDFTLGDGVIEALKGLKSGGYRLILVSNQPNYALGKCSLSRLGEIHGKMLAELAAAGVTFARFCYCLHHPKGVVPGYGGTCACRKPSPWFLEQARADFGLRMEDSWMVGDQPSDMACGRAAGVRTVRIGSAGDGDGRAGKDGARLDDGVGRVGIGCGDGGADYVAGDLREAAAIILGMAETR